MLVVDVAAADLDPVGAWSCRNGWAASGNTVGNKIETFAMEVSGDGTARGQGSKQTVNGTFDIRFEGAWNVTDDGLTVQGEATTSNPIFPREPFYFWTRQVSAHEMLLNERAPNGMTVTSACSRTG